MTSHKVLVGLDGSARAPSVLAAAVELAELYCAPLKLVRAICLPPEIPAEAWTASGVALREHLEREARIELEQLRISLDERARSRVSVDVVTGTPWQALCIFAMAHGATLIVVGSHGYGGFDRMLGTTAARVVDHALCSVFVVRDSATR